MLANASDADGQPLTANNLQIVSGNGMLADNLDGSWSYTPAPDDDTAVSFSYTVTDGNTAPVAASATLDLTPVNDAPLAQADDNGADRVRKSHNGFGDATASGNVLANDTDADAFDILTVTAVNGADLNVGASVAGTYGSLVLGADGLWTYTLDETDFDTVALAPWGTVYDAFTYTMMDNGGATATADLTVTVEGAEDFAVPHFLMFTSSMQLGGDRTLELPKDVAFLRVDSDPLGTATIELSGEGAAMFEFDVPSSRLRLKAGSVLDAGLNPILNVTISLEIPGAGPGPEQVRNFAVELVQPGPDTFLALPSGSQFPINVITYSFETLLPPNYPLSPGERAAYTSVTEAGKIIARASFQQWSDAANLILIETPAGTGDVRIGSTLLPFPDIFASTFFPPGAGGTSSDIVFNNIGGAFLELDQSIWLHEIGHAIGLKHSFEGAVNNQLRLDSAFDDNQFTVMSYTAAQAGPDFSLGPLDIQAAQFLYGAVDSAVWSYDPVALILTQQAGAGAQSLAGFAFTDVMSGGGGDDTLDGGSGFLDVAVYSGGFADYLIAMATIPSGPDPRISVADQRAGSPDGTDIVQNVELFRFADGDRTIFQVLGISGPPIITSEATASVAENTAGTVYTVVATAPDAGNQQVFSLSGPDDAFFTIDPVTGAVSFLAAPDFELPKDADANNIYDVVVHATNGPSETSQQVTIAVTNVGDPGEAPVITSGATASVEENTSGIAYTITGNNAEAGSQRIYSIDGADSHLFFCDEGTGDIFFFAGPDFESPADADGDNVYDIVVHALDLNPDFTFTEAAQSVSITVTDVANETPIFTGTLIDFAENSTAAVHAISTIPELSATFSLFGTDADLFSFDAAGVISFLTPPDFESPADFGNDNVYDFTAHVVQQGTIQGIPFNFTTDENIRVQVTDIDETPIFDFSGTTSPVAMQSTEGDDVLVGGPGHDVLFGDQGNDLMTGGVGSDVFIFTPGFGNDVITDFAVGTDKIALSLGSAFDSFDEIFAASSQVGEDTIISIDGESSITLLNVATAGLHANDFLMA